MKRKAAGSSQIWPSHGRNCPPPGVQACRAGSCQGDEYPSPSGATRSGPCPTIGPRSTGIPQQTTSAPARTMSQRRIDTCRWEINSSKQFSPKSKITGNKLPINFYGEKSGWSQGIFILLELRSKLMIFFFVITKLNCSMAPKWNEMVRIIR